jgi:hypothetical protein
LNDVLIDKELIDGFLDLPSGYEVEEDTVGLVPYVGLVTGFFPLPLHGPRDDLFEDTAPSGAA